MSARSPMTRLARRVLAGALAGAAVGVVIGLLVHVAFDLKGWPSTAEVIGGGVGLLLGAIIGGYHGALSAAPRDSHRRVLPGGQRPL